MTKLLLSLNAVFALLIGLLLYKVYTPNTVEKQKTTPTKRMESGTSTSTNKIAFVYADSINDNYAFIKEKKQALEADEKRMSASLEMKTKALQNRFLELNQKAATLSQKEAEAAQLELQQKEQEITELRYKMAEELELKRSKLQKDFFTRVNDYLKEYNKTAGYDYIFSYAEGGQVLLADEALDITQEILLGLNEAYASSKNTKK